MFTTSQGSGNDSTIRRHPSPFWTAPVGSVGFSSWVLLWSAPTVPCGYVCRSKLSGIGCPEAEVKRPILSVGIPGKGFLRDDTRVYPQAGISAVRLAGSSSISIRWTPDSGLTCENTHFAQLMKWALNRENCIEWHRMSFGRMFPST